METEAAGFEVLPGLLDEFTKAAYYKFAMPSQCSAKHKSLARLLPTELFNEFAQGSVEAYPLVMGCIDFVASMTDSYAISLYRKIKGISLPTG